MPNHVDQVATKPSAGKRGNDRILEEGRAAAGKRKESTEEAIERSQRLIERDVEKHHGIYPMGAITAAEVLRRAGLNVRLLAKPRHHELRAEVNAWVERVQKRVLQGSEVIRRAVTERKDVAEATADAIRQRWVEAELEYVEAQNAMRKLHARCAELEAENARLRASLGGPNVIAIRQDER